MRRLLTLGVAAAALLAPATATAKDPVPPPRVPGIDVSRFQEEIDWDAVALDGVQFAFVQASRGSGKDCSVVPRECGVDGYYDSNYLEAKSFGIRVGPYHRAFVGGNGPTQVKADARAEARLFSASVGELGGTDLRPALDMETPFSDLSPFELRLWARTWLRSVERRLGSRPIIYTNVSSWNALGNPTWFARKEYPLWVANWNVSVPQVPANNWGGSSWRVWQHSSSGSVDGIKGRVDLNWLRFGWDGVSVNDQPVVNRPEQNDRIVGGSPVPISQVPWQVSVALSPEAQPDWPASARHICGGSLVAPTLVITAAHCVYSRGFRPAAEFSVISGRTNLDSGEGVESSLVGYRQFGYDPRTSAWDVVLMQLAEPAIGEPIQLAGPDEGAIWRPGRSLLASGWGAVSENGPPSPDLLATELRLYGTSCFGRRVDDPATCFCAGSALGDRDTCYGDSGGPVAAPMAEGGYRLIGDTSYGFGKCGSFDPGAYGRLSAEPMRSVLADAALSLAGVNIVGSGGHAPTTLTETQARENAWIWVDKDCARFRACRSYAALTCSAQASTWVCPVKEVARDNRGRFTCRRKVQVSASSGSLVRKPVGRWRCR